MKDFAKPKNTFINHNSSPFFTKEGTCESSPEMNPVPFFPSANIQPKLEINEPVQMKPFDLRHVMQQTRSNKVSRKAEVGLNGNYTGNYLFHPGQDGLRGSFFYKVKQNVADGPLNDIEIAALRKDAIDRNGTIIHAELLLMAAMRNPVNVRLMKAHMKGSLSIPMNQILQSDQDYLTNFGRGYLPNDIISTNIRLIEAMIGISNENAGMVDMELRDKTKKQILEHAGAQFAEQAGRLYFDAESTQPEIPLTVILSAMLNGASDSTPGDKVLAGIVYSVARRANHPMADHILSGKLKVDALTPEAYNKMVKKGEAYYVYSTDIDTLKSDTLYMPTYLDIWSLSDRSLIIHELTHAAEDFATIGGRRDMDSLGLETRAYKAQGRFMMDQILASPDAPSLIESASEYSKQSPLYYWSMVAAAKDNIHRYEDVLVTVNSANPMSKPKADIMADFGLLYWDIDSRVKRELLAYRDKKGKQVYFNDLTSVEGATGHYFHF
jgi:hypothetical protein